MVWIWKWSRAEGKAARADKMLQVCLTGNRESSEEVVLNAARGVVIGKERRDRRWPDVQRLSQGDWEFRKRRLVPFPGHLEHEVRLPASLEQGSPQWQAAWEGQCLQGPRPTGRGLARWRASSGLRMLKKLRADSKLSTDSHEAWPKAEPSHVPLGLGAAYHRAGCASRTQQAEAGTCRPCVA